MPFHDEETDGVPIEIHLRGGYDGISGNRDPEAPCEGFWQDEEHGPADDPDKPWTSSKYKGCQSDGHYLCRECVWRPEHLDE